MARYIQEDGRDDLIQAVQEGEALEKQMAEGDDAPSFMKEQLDIQGVHEFAENAEQRLPCVLLLDNSGSMRGERYQQLVKGLHLFKEETCADSIAKRRVEVAIITYGDKVRVEDFTLIPNLQLPNLKNDVYGYDDPMFIPGGGTPMGEGIMEAYKALSKRMRLYHHNKIPFYVPWVINITDGASNGDHTLFEEAVKKTQEKIGSLDNSKPKLVFVNLAVDGADTNKLKLLSDKTIPINGHNFKEFFEWLSASISIVSKTTDGQKAKISAFEI